MPQRHPDTAYQLVSDFYAEVDRVLKEISP